MEDRAWIIEGDTRPGPWVITCDHATNRIPPFVNGGTLGLSPEQMERHIAYDLGAAGVARELGRLLDSPVIYSTFSRLVIDPNRGEDDPTLIMQVYDGTIIPGNRGIDAAERQRRLERLYRPYHAAVAELLASRPGAALCAVHSFTPRLVGHAPRPWHVGILSADDRRLAEPLLRRLSAPGNICVGDNEPYGGHLPGDSVDRHALAHGRLNALIEIRHDLIRTHDEQTAWAERLAGPLDEALAEALAADHAPAATEAVEG